MLLRFLTAQANVAQVLHQLSGCRSGIRSLLVLLVFATTAFPLANAIGFNGRSQVRVIIIDEAGTCIHGATVRFTRGDEEQVKVATSDDGVEFELEPGEYILLIEAQHFRSETRETVHVVMGEDIDMRITLTPGQVSEPLGDPPEPRVE